MQYIEHGKKEIAGPFNTNKNMPHYIQLFGSGGVGKTALVRALTGQPFEKRYLPTTQEEYITLPSGDVIIDTPGQYILEIAVSPRATFGLILYDDRKQTKAEANQYARMCQSAGIPYKILRNKSDIDNDPNNGISCRISRPTGLQIN